MAELEVICTYEKMMRHINRMPSIIRVDYIPDQYGPKRSVEDVCDAQQYRWLQLD